MSGFDTLGGTCDNADCDAPTPWDMPAIVVDDRACCSPDCAHRVAWETDGLERITLHDPQYATPRPDGVSEDAVSVTWTATETQGVVSVIDAIEALYPTEFRMHYLTDSTGDTQ